MDGKKILLFILLVVFVTGIIIFLAPKTAKAPTKITTPTPTQQPLALCKDFPTVSSEVGCKEAADKALSLYKGTVTDIVMANNLKKSGDKNQQGIQAWRIAILLDKPVEENGEVMTSIRITLDRQNGNVFSQYFFK